MIQAKALELEFRTRWIEHDHKVSPSHYQLTITDICVEIMKYTYPGNLIFTRD